MTFLKGEKMYINYESNTIGYLDITFGPKWDYIPLTKNFIENFLLVNVVDKKSISKIAMSASELLENAVKFSNKDGIRMVVRKHSKKNVIELKVYNYVEEADAKGLKERIKAMISSDPLQFYIAKMKESVTRKDGKSGLGLARIYYEGEAKITADYIKDSKVVELTAIFDVK
jgi:hypothetical protein